MSNEKQNSLTSRIRIGFGGSFQVLKQQFVKIKEAEYSTNFEFFLTNQILVNVSENNSCLMCSSLENRIFHDSVNSMDDAFIFELIQNIHRDIITFKYKRELIY